MREALGEFSRFVTLVELVMCIETAIGQTIADAELEQVQTLRDLARVVRLHLGADFNSETRSLAVVADAARVVSGIAITAFDVPLLEALPPQRGRE